MACDPVAIEGGLDLSTVCLELSIDVEALLDLSLILPGGVQIQALLEPGILPDASAVTNSILAQTNAALAPLVPIFVLIDVVLALVDCVKAIPEAIGPPPDPTAIIRCLEKLLKAVTQLLKLIPQLSIPLLVKGMCDLLAASLQGLYDQLACLLVFQVRLDASRAKLDNLINLGLLDAASSLELQLDCAQSNLDLQRELNAASARPMNTLIRLINLFLRLIGLAEIPSFEVSSNFADATNVLDALAVVIRTLRILCNSIPV